MQVRRWWVGFVLIVCVGCGGATRTAHQGGSGGASEGGLAGGEDDDGGAESVRAEALDVGGDDGEGNPIDVCGDGLDNDGNGHVDDGCACEAGRTQPCFVGPVHAAGRGACSRGTQRCERQSEFTYWGACEGFVAPSGEICNGIDDNCDGNVDEGCVCTVGSTQACYGGERARIGVGVCSAGVQACAGTTWEACRGEVLPSVETCDGFDNDCDGVIDGLLAACYTGPAGTQGVGLCYAGTRTCEAGVWFACVDEALPVAETCNGFDDDCDGVTDEGCVCMPGDTRACYDGPAATSGVGACADGTQTCIEGHWSACEGATHPVAEVCDGLDNNCDGAADEGCGCIDGDVRACYDGAASTEGVGECRAGMQRCAAGTWEACEGSTAPDVEACDGRDNDCDGAIDGIARACYSGPPETRDTGICHDGVQTCVAASWEACAGEALPQFETCNGVDDDCDGTVDEDCTCTPGETRDCYDAEPVTIGVGLCHVGAQTCVAGTWRACEGAVLPTDERCDGLDNDCDGVIDNGCDCVAGEVRGCYDGPAGTMGVGVCDAGSQTCVLGVWSTCAGEALPGAEVCDGLDNNCDGVVDGLVQACYAGPAGTMGVGLCVAGTQSCTAGVWGTCAGQVLPAVDICDDGVDSDCDGETDEGCACEDDPLYGTPCDGDDADLCADGTYGCAPTLTCLDDSAGAPDICDGLDNDCNPATPDGSDDASVGVPCDGPDADLCTEGVWTCSGGALACSDATDDLAEVCDGLDNDCNPATLDGADDDLFVPSVTACGISWDRRPVIEFTPIPAGFTYNVYIEGEATPFASLSDVGRNHFRPFAELGPGAPPPGQTVSMVVQACNTSGGASCCALSSTIDVQLIEACATPVAPSNDNIIISEYVINGDGSCPGGTCEAGEAVEITNLSHCPVDLNGHHFAYCNPGSCTTFRWMDFDATAVVPPRGVYVAVRNLSASSCGYDPALLAGGATGLFGLNVSVLTMESNQSLASGWFNNAGGGRLRVASGPFVDMDTGATFDNIDSYSGAALECQSIGYDAYDVCGDVSSDTLEDLLDPNQLGRLWHPCDAVAAPVPACG